MAMGVFCNTEESLKTDNCTQWITSKCKKNENNEYRMISIRRRNSSIEIPNGTSGSIKECVIQKCQVVTLLQPLHVRVIGFSIGGAIVLISLICAYIYVRKRFSRKRDKESLLNAAYSTDRGGRVRLHPSFSESETIENDLYGASIPSPTWQELHAARHALENESGYEAVLGENLNRNCEINDGAVYEEIGLSNKKIENENGIDSIENDLYYSTVVKRTKNEDTTPAEKPEYQISDEYEQYAEIK